MNRKKGLFNKRIPTFLVFIVLAIIVIISTILVKSGVFYVGNAAPDTLPQNLSVTNITDTSFTVTFTTTGNVNAVVSITNGNIGNSLILDDRDKKTGNQNNYYSHHISVPNLNPLTSYTFKIIVAGKEYSDPSYKVTTGPAISGAPPRQNPIVGTVLETNGSPAKDTLVTAVTQSSQVVSAVTNNNGQFIIPTNSLRNNENTSYEILQDTTPFTITAFKKNLKTKVQTTFSVSQNLPPVTLQQQYNFSPTKEGIATSASELDLSLPVSNGRTIDILNPKEGESLIDQRPLFSGVSYPNSPVTIDIQNLVEGKVISNGSGTWSYRPDSNLPQGESKVTIKTPDNTGTLIQVTHNFSIFPLGSQVAMSATPSATPTLTITPTQIPTTPTLVPTATIAVTPTVVPTLEPSPTASITATISPTIILPTSIPTATPTIANPGGTTDTMILTGISVILIIAGAALLFAL